MRKCKNERGQCSQTPSANVRQPLAVLAHLKVPMDLMHPNNRRHEHGKVNLILPYWDFRKVSCNVVMYIVLRKPTKTSSVPKAFYMQFSMHDGKPHCPWVHSYFVEAEAWWLQHNQAVQPVIQHHVMWRMRQNRNGFATVTVMDMASGSWYRHKMVVPHVHLTV